METLHETLHAKDKARRGNCQVPGHIYQESFTKILWEVSQ